MRTEIEFKRSSTIKELYCFLFNQNTLILDYYEYQEKDPNKRKWNIVKRYERIMKRNSTIDESDIPWTSEIRNAALEKFCSDISVKLWSEFKSL